MEAFSERAVIDSQREKNLRFKSIQLADGNRFFLAADFEMRFWLEELARIMELPESHSRNHPYILYTKIKSLRNDAKPELTALGRTLIGDVSQAEGHAARMGPVRVWSWRSIPHRLCEIYYDYLDPEYGVELHEISYLNMWMSLQPIFMSSVEKGGLPLHGALAEINGQGVILAGRGGTGKSTCIRRLPFYYNPLCDDELLAVVSPSGEYRAHPFPTWSSYMYLRGLTTWNVQNHIPVAAIFFLEQAEKDEVTQLGNGLAASLLNNSANQVCYKFWRRIEASDKNAMKTRLFNNSCEFVKAVPAYNLKVSLNGRFWEKIESVLAVHKKA